MHSCHHISDDIFLARAFEEPDFNSGTGEANYFDIIVRSNASRTKKKRLGITNLPVRDEPFHLSPICSEAGVGSVVPCGGRAFALVPLCGQKEAVSFFLVGLGNILRVRDS